MPAGKYYPLSVPLTQEQRRELASGKHVVLDHDDLHRPLTPSVLHFTKTQYNTLAKMIKSGRGAFKFKYSKAQMKHSVAHIVDGDGALSDLFSKGLSLAKKGGLALAEKYSGNAVDALANVIKKPIIGMLPSSLQKYAEMGLQLGTDLTKDQLQGVIHGIQHSETGSGLFHSVKGSGILAPGY